MLHMLKLCVGVDTLAEMSEWQRKRNPLCHWTRNWPKRQKEITAGGSIYWVIKGQIRVRQRLKAIQRHTDPDGWTGCALVLDRKLIATVPRLMRAMQGRRYLEAEDAPVDLAVAVGKGDDLPPKLVAELRALGLL